MLMIQTSKAIVTWYPWVGGGDDSKEVTLQPRTASLPTSRHHPWLWRTWHHLTKEHLGWFVSESAVFNCLTLNLLRLIKCKINVVEHGNRCIFAAHRSSICWPPADFQSLNDLRRLLQRHHANGTTYWCKFLINIILNWKYVCNFECEGVLWART